MKVLVLTPYLPHSRVGHGGGTAVRNLVKALSRLHRVDVVALVRPGEGALLDDVASLGVEVHGIPFVDRGARGYQRVALVTSRLQAAGRAVATRYPLFVAKYGQPSLLRAVAEAVRRIDPDVIQIEYLQLALALRNIRRLRDRDGNRRPGLVLGSHELSSLPRQRRAAVTRDPARRAWLHIVAHAWERLQVDASTWADATLCVTPQDHELFAQLGGQNLQTVPLGVDTDRVPFRPADDGATRALFLGSFQHPPNRVAAKLLLETIWPALREALPTWELALAGPGSDTFLANISGSGADGVQGLGYVDDLDALFATSRLFLAPLTEGGGIKIKVLEAMARGIPVVTTAIGAEGITDAADETVWLASDIDDFARQVLAAAQQPQEAARRAWRARRHIEERFSWLAIAAQLTEIYEHL